MRKILTLFIFCLFISTNSFSQGLQKKVADDVCKCLNKMDISEMPYSEFETEMAGCMLSSISGLSEKQIKKEKLNVYDEQSMRKFGEGVGQEMAASCPAFEAKIMELMTENDSELLELVKEEKGITPDREYHELNATLVEIKEDKFATLIIKDENGKSHELIWIKYFENSENLIENSEAWIGKTLTFKYLEYEAFLPKAGGYYKIKEVSNIKFGS